jgi:hypothetical protein
MEEQPAHDHGTPPHQRRQCLHHLIPPPYSALLAPGQRGSVQTGLVGVSGVIVDRRQDGLQPGVPPVAMRPGDPLLLVRLDVVDIRAVGYVPQPARRTSFPASRLWIGGAVPPASRQLRTGLRGWCSRPTDGASSLDPVVESCYRSGQDTPESNNAIQPARKTRGSHCVTQEGLLHGRWWTGT